MAQMRRRRLQRLRLLQACNGANEEEEKSKAQVVDLEEEKHSVRENMKHSS